MRKIHLMITVRVFNYKSCISADLWNKRAAIREKREKPLRRVEAAYFYLRKR